MSNASVQSDVLTVTGLTNAIKSTLEGNFLHITVQGEISNFKKQSSGHLYFSLKDANAQIQAVMFKGRAEDLKKIPKDGDNVIVKGDISVYPPQGKYQINIYELQFAGLGELLLKLEELKRKIHKKGWFRSEHKKPIPMLPRRIGVITSPTGAAIRDILNVLTRRFAGVHVILNPVRVQGAEAPGEIAEAIKQLNDHELVDVIILGRGGGSIEDLWAFNEEIVAEAVFNSRIPIVCAVGHETDHCIAEYVADMRAPTPSAAAELVMAEKNEQVKHLAQITLRLNQLIFHYVKQCRQKLSNIKRHPTFASPYQILGPWMQRLDILKGDIDKAMRQSLVRKKLLLQGCQKQAQSLQPSAQITHFKEKLRRFVVTLDRTVLTNILTRKKERLAQIVSLLKGIDPKNLLAKGYSIVFSEKDGLVINSISRIQQNDSLTLLVSDGKILTTVQKTIKDEKKS